MFKTFFVILIYLHSASFQLLSVNIADIFLNHTDQSSYNNNYDFYIPRGNNSELDTFSWNFFKTVLINETNHNVFLSPFSVKLTLAILLEAAGANSETQKELQKSQTIMNTEILRQHYKNTLTKLQQQNVNTKFNLQTKIFTDEFINPQQRYGAILQNYYNTEIQSINFKNPKTAAFLINDWCNNASNGQIQKIVSEETIQNNILILANVIYFKGLWMHEFNETFEGIFFKGFKNSTRATYMEQTGNFYYLNSEQFNCKVLRLPYKDNSFSMFIILPNNEEDIDKSTSFLSAITINQLQWLLEERKVKVNLPKFKIQFSKSLKDSLNYLGVGEIFMNSASLPGLARGGDVAGRLKVTNIIQTAGVDVNEKGTEASAATVVEVGNKFGGSQTIEEFIVNRSFIFFIEDEIRGEILFGGKVIEPIYTA